MDQPGKDGSSADHGDGSLGGLDDHHASGVANHFFHLLVEGSGKKTVNVVAYDSPASDGSTLTGIGREKAYQTRYRTLSVHMTSTADYAGARVATEKAATDLFGADSEELKAVSATWPGSTSRSPRRTEAREPVSPPRAAGFRRTARRPTAR